MASGRTKADIACYPGFVAILRARGQAKRSATRRAFETLARLTR
jgi:hypothetical protein